MAVPYGARLAVLSEVRGSAGGARVSQEARARIAAHLQTPLPSLRVRVIEAVQAVSAEHNVNETELLAQLQARVGQDSFFDWCGAPGRTLEEVLEVLNAPDALEPFASRAVMMERARAFLSEETCAHPTRLTCRRYADFALVQGRRMLIEMLESLRDAPRPSVRGWASSGLVERERAAWRRDIDARLAALREQDGEHYETAGSESVKVRADGLLAALARDITRSGAKPHPSEAADAISAQVEAVAEVVLTQAQFDALGEYSRTLPTGTTVGKRWKRRVRFPDRDDDVWYMGEYVPCDIPGSVGIAWKRIRVEQ